MPANLPPEYFEVEKEYRRASTVEEKIALLEELLSIVPQHKGTERLRGDLRRRLSKLRATAETRKRTGRRESPFRIDKEGAGQVAVVGCPNVGKSALVAALTNATPEVADYPYTTWRPTPGMMPVEDIQIQLIDTPPLSRDVAQPELMDLIRRADLILLVVDLQTYPLQQLEDALTILEAYRIVPHHRRDRYPNLRRLTSIPMLVLANKADDEQSDEDFEVLCELLGDEWTVLAASATTGRHLDRLKRAIFEQLDIIRVYSKPPGKEPDFSTPFVLKRGSTVEELAGKIHQDFLENLKWARVWGRRVRDGQMVARDYVLEDGDVVELRI